MPIRKNTGRSFITAATSGGSMIQMDLYIMLIRENIICTIKQAEEWHQTLQIFGLNVTGDTQ